MEHKPDLIIFFVYLLVSAVELYLFDTAFSAFQPVRLNNPIVVTAKIDSKNVGHILDVFFY